MFRIKIVEITTKTTAVKVWQKLNDNDKDPKQYGYAEPVERTEKVEREVLTQELEIVDISAVVKAINGLS